MTRLTMLAVLLASAAVACADEQPAGPGACTIATNPTAASVTAGNALYVSATVDCERGPAPSVRWASTAPDVVSVDSLTGLAQAVGPGAAEIVASTVGSPALSARVLVRVLCAASPLYAIGVSPTAATLAPVGAPRSSRPRSPTVGAARHSRSSRPA